MGIAALVLGIVSLVFCFLGPISFVAPIVGIVGIILGVIARKKAKEAKEPTGAATAGFVMSIIGVVLGAIVWLTCVACASVATKGLSELANDPKLQKQLEEATKELDKAAKEAEKAAQGK